MNSLAFVTHPSVRIKGTENSYTPNQCLDERCPVKAPHMHCPFCVKTDAYQDPVILKAHYRVKHVDKGIEFAGLKILRCCDHCDIVGIIKGEKRFKGAHWHCYRCRNGFNRRDEAIKHYKTHFRNPQTTFQIQITQDLNSPPGVKPLDDPSGLQQETFPSIENPVEEIIHPALTQAAMSLSEHNVVSSDANKFTKVHVKEEHMLKEIGVMNSEDEQTIMIIQGDPLQSTFASHVINSSGEVSILNKGNMDPSLSWEIRFRIEEEAKKLFKAQAEEYKNQVDLLQQRVSELESQLSQASDLKVQDLLSSLSVGDPDKQLLAQQISKYLEELETSEDGTSDPSSMVASSHHLVTGDGLVHTFKLEPASSLEQELDVGHDDADEEDMNSVSDTYQVISSVVDSHRVLINHTPPTDDAHTIPLKDDSVVVTAGTNSSALPLHHSAGGASSVGSNSVVVSQQSVESQTQPSSQPSDIFSTSSVVVTEEVPPTTSGDDEDHDMIVSQVLSSTMGDHHHHHHHHHHHQQQQLSASAQGLLDVTTAATTTTSLQSTREDHHHHTATVLNIGTAPHSQDAGGGGGGGLLQVVAAADGLASLGTDVTVMAAPGDSSDAARTFIMQVQNGQQLLVQRGGDEGDSTLQPLGEDLNSQESKRPRLS